MSLPAATTRLEVSRGGLAQTRWRTIDAPSLAEGEVRCRVERFALTANNVTYGAFGDALGYWRFFPTGDAAWGLVPAWGFATVVASRAEGVEPGSRWWGYWPMADHAVLTPTQIGGSSFLDGAAHRRELAVVYNRYVRAERRDGDDLEALFRPLFTTSCLIDDFLAEADWFGADQVLLSSASSKTAWGLAWCLAERRRRDPAARLPRVVGLTSAAHLAFVRSLGSLDDVVDYTSLDAIDASASSVFVDMRGSAGFRADVHARWQDRLRHSCSVGAAEWQAVGSGHDLPGPRPTLFFAPTQAARRLAEWGAAEFESRLAVASRGFLVHVGHRVSDGEAHLRVVEVEGQAAIDATWRALVAGTVPPDEGRVAVFAAARGER